METFSDPGWDGDGLAIVVEQASFLGGTERVADAIVARWPRTEVVVTRFEKESVDGLAPAWLRTGRGIALPGRRRHLYAPLYARRVARAEPVVADVVVAFHSVGWATAIKTVRGARIFAYCAGPPRSHFREYRAYLTDYPPLVRPLAIAALPALRRHTLGLIRRADRVFAPSHWAAAELAARVRRPVAGLYPPVRVSELTPGEPQPDGPILAVARLSTRQKRIGPLVEAFRGLDRELVVVGGGPLLEPLRRDAPANVRFTGAVRDGELTRLYRSASALVCPSVEEFGIVMAEALACGLPVIAPRAGGALEIVEHGRTGLLVDDVSPAGLRAAVGSLDELRFDRHACRRSAERFSEEAFTRGLSAHLDAALGRAPATGFTDRADPYPRTLPETVG
jgi:glycosyltransferase involved in cell wall biosynthesis